MSEKVKVRIYCEQTVRYSRQVEVSPSVVAEYEAAVARDADEEWFNQFAQRLIDPLQDADDSDDYEDVELTVIKDPATV